MTSVSGRGHVADQIRQIVDRIYDESGTAVVAIWSFIAGISLTCDATIDGFDVSTVLRAVPDVIKLWLSLSLIIGGGLASLGMLWTWRRLDYAWRVEQGGWWFILGGWTFLAVIVGIYSLTSFLAWGTFFAFAVVAFLRQRKVRGTERSTIHDIENGSAE